MQPLRGLLAVIFTVLVVVSSCSCLTAGTVLTEYRDILQEGLSLYVDLVHEWSSYPPPVVVEKGTRLPEDPSDYVAVYDGKELVIKPGCVGDVTLSNGCVCTYQGPISAPPDYLLVNVNDFETNAGNWPLPRIVVSTDWTPYVVYLGSDSVSVVNASTGQGVAYVQNIQPEGISEVEWKDPGFDLIVNVTGGAVSVSIPGGTVEPAQGSSTTFLSLRSVQVSESGISMIGGPPALVSRDGTLLFPTSDAVVSYLLSQALPDPSSLSGALKAALQALEDPGYVSTWSFLLELPGIAEAVTPSWVTVAPWVFESITVYPMLTVTTAFLLAKVLATVARVLHATRVFLRLDDSFKPVPLLNVIEAAAAEYLLYYEEILLHYGLAKDVFYALGLGFMWQGDYSPWDALIPPLYEEWVKRICAAVFGLSPLETGIILGAIEFVNHVEAGWVEPVPGYLLDRVVIHGVLGSLPYVEAVALHAWCNWDYTDWESVFAGVCAVIAAWYEFEAQEEVTIPGWDRFEEALRGAKATLEDIVRERYIPGGLRSPSSRGVSPASGDPLRLYRGADAAG